ncbi:hypothetical protein PIB30_023851 [Stylosanthes scabra]|uniref:Uncharacterized protein n=1 Tax=Stylosanthes scabra TaxID=79078 RepID=A0ABU6R9X9_9FABA|nr:hypothetical protein [Stylosanthes scabra]
MDNLGVEAGSRQESGAGQAAEFELHCAGCAGVMVNSKASAAGLGRVARTTVFAHSVRVVLKLGEMMRLQNVTIPGKRIKRTCSACPPMVVCTLPEPLRVVMGSRVIGPRHIPDVIDPNEGELLQVESACSWTTSGPVCWLVGSDGGGWDGDGQDGKSSPNDSN